MLKESQNFENKIATPSKVSPKRGLMTEAKIGLALVGLELFIVISTFVIIDLPRGAGEFIGFLIGIILTLAYLFYVIVVIVNILLFVIAIIALCRKSYRLRVRLIPLWIFVVHAIASFMLTII